LKFRKEEYSDVVPHSDSVVREIDNKVFMNIRRSHLHFVGARAHVFPYSKAIEWIINHIDLNNNMFVNEKGDCVGSFLAENLEKYYKFPKPKLLLVTPFATDFYDKHDVGKILANWWKKYKRFFNKTNGWYPIASLREPYMYLMVSICQLYEEKDC
jgi:hypothetical protein